MEKLSSTSPVYRGDQVRFWYSVTTFKPLLDVGMGSIADFLGATKGVRTVRVSGQDIDLKFLKWGIFEDTGRIYVEYELLTGPTPPDPGAITPKFEPTTGTILAGVLALVVITGLVLFVVMVTIPESQVRIKSALDAVSSAGGDVLSNIGEGLTTGIFPLLIVGLVAVYILANSEAGVAYAR